MSDPSTMDVVVRLHGTVPLPEPRASRSVQLTLPEEATVADLLRRLAEDYPASFGGPGRPCVFAGHVHLSNPKLRLRDRLAPEMELSVALLRAVPGG